MDNIDNLKSYQQFGENLLSTKNEAVATAGELISRNIGHLRDFAATLLTVNITVVGATLAALIPKRPRNLGAKKLQ